VSNDPVLLLHGQPGAAADWERLRASIGDGVRTIAIDRPGWDGQSAVTDLGGNASAATAALDQAGDGRRPQHGGGGRGMARVRGA